MSKICVTGGAGFIGSNLAKALLNSGHRVTVIDNLETGKLENIKEFFTNKNFKFVRGSILENKKLDEALNDAEFVFHKAALIDINESIKNPKKTYKINALGTLNVLNKAVENGAKRIIFASSSAIYGSKKSPVKENMQSEPESPYVISKIIGESLVKHFYKKHRLEFVILRYFNVYGPKQNVTSQYAAVVPSFISNALKGNNLVIYGDGKQTRDFVFIEDVVNANILAMENEKAIGKIFNIGFGKSIAINDLAKKIIELSGRNSKIVHTKPRACDIKHSVADITLARNVLKYNPVYNIDQGLKKTMGWFKSGAL